MVARKREQARPLVLLVDDGTRHAMLLKLALMQRGYAIVVAQTLEGAVTMASVKAFDLLIVLMPAPEAAHAFEALGESRPSSTIVVGEDAERALSVGFDLAMPTPVDFGELDAAMQKLLARRGSGTRRRAVIVR